jgi:light-regulated signal transduction histidine kinase (bacteriophytochrome)
LEQRVQERTTELEAANKELEAFSYSVSHDLQSPLRSINSFTQYVLEDYGTELPTQAREDLERVQRSGQDMQQLIEHLLLFSRSSRQPITKISLDMAALVHETYNELMATQDGRLVEFIVGDLPPCLADRALLKQVFRNLLGNALKFTSKKEKPVVRVNCVHCDSEVVYSVRDNGAGFDMKHAGKLFGAFQRLHQASDFQGTGLGLSIVQRIVERHGGRVWAEGKIDEGATFYFTLPCG